MEHQVNVRPAKNHDAKRIFDFICMLEEQLFDQELFLQQYQKCTADPDNIYLVAAGADNSALGFISCHGQLLLHHAGMVYEIQEVFVDPAHRNKGIGRQLLRALEDRLLKINCESLEVTTKKGRTETRRFYVENGFEQTHVKFTKRA